VAVLCSVHLPARMRAGALRACLSGWPAARTPNAPAAPLPPLHSGLLQELKAAQLAEKVLTRTVVELQRNLSALAGELGSGLAGLRAQMLEARGGGGGVGGRVHWLGS
jgi:hypothetical protein